MKSELLSEKSKMISEGIYQIKLPIPSFELAYVLSYLVTGKNGYLLVDSGWNSTETFNALEKQLSEININLSDISLILVTHLHPDHFGLANKIRKKSKAKIIMHTKAGELIKQFNNTNAYFNKMMEWLKINGTPSSELEEWIKQGTSTIRFFEPQEPDILLNDGEILDLGNFRFDVIFTPGHSPDHICLYEPSKKFLFSGDHVLPTITPNVSLQTKNSGNPLRDYLESLKKISNLKVKNVLPAHEYIFKNLEKRILEIEKHHEKRLGEVLSVIKTPKTAYQIAQEITWSTGSWDKLQEWEQRMATFEALAHLEYLKSEGKISTITQNENILFYRKSNDFI
jgi:glyoxylase-like metal-dependent hydrolase (beta-lactamase superfamily II)